MWLILLIALALICYLSWLFCKLWQLSQRKARIQRTAMTQHQASPVRFARRKQRKE